jgi:hypothetical protein
MIPVQSKRGLNSIETTSRGANPSAPPTRHRKINFIRLPDVCAAMQFVLKNSIVSTPQKIRIPLTK